MGFKRKRVYAPRRSGFKKKRTVQRRRARKVSAYTSKTGSGHTFGFKSKRISRRRWKKMLWDSTLQSTHYRSQFALHTTSTTPAFDTQYQTTILPAYRIGGNQFYTTAGGFVPPDVGISTGFVGNIVVRGGTVGLTVSNVNAGVETQRFKIFLIKTSRAWTGVSFPANPTIGWDPSTIVDFKQTIGTILLSKDFLLENSATMDLKYRLPVHKIDRDEYNSDLNSYVWAIFGNDVAGGSSQWFNVTYFNLSFASDAVGTA